VPADLIGMHRDALPSAIDDYGWEVRDETTRVDGTEPGEILETRPAAGEMLREGATLTVVVSEGPTLVDLPADLVGMTADDAAAALEAVGLTAEQVPTRREDVDEGVVVGFADGDPGGQVPKGSTVRLAVSSGAGLPMPDVTGQSHADAVATLTAAGLEVDVEDESDDSVAPGVVIRTDPEAGEDVEPGDTVTVVVAFTEVEVPDVGGDRFDRAARKVEAAGLSVGRVTGPEDGRVLATWPLEGTEVQPGSTVDLIMGRR
jgi:serine/threonine-protein kinase